MARNGKSAATVETRDPKDFYDSLSQDAKDIWDTIGQLGYTPEKGVTNLWFARKTNSKHAASVGPCESLHELLAGVKDEIRQEQDDIEMGRVEPDFDNQIDDESSAGDGYLFPEMKPTHQKEIKELNVAIMNYESYKRERIDALSKELECKKEVEGLMRANRESLAFDPKTGIRSYRCNDYIEELVPGEEKLKSRRATDDDEE